MKRLLAPLFVVSLVAGPAFAADITAISPPPPGPIYGWAGFYMGFTVGWLDTANSGTTNAGTDNGVGGLGTLLAGGAIPNSLNVAYRGFLGGGLIGYNWQAGSWVFGLEADINGSGAKGDMIAGPIALPGFVPVATVFNREIDWFSTYRVRIGATVMPTFLLYGTGGLAVGQTRIGNAFNCAACTPPSATEPAATNQTTNISVGWTAGAGAEWMFAPNWSLKGEYIYVDLGSHSSTITYAYAPSTSSLTSTARDSVNILRGGINYKF
jgi:outer membrane immunogenic protein